MSAFEQREIETPRGTIRYRDSGGGGDPLVFVHGLLVNGRLWDDAAERLADAGHRCIVPDWPMGSHRVPMNPDADLSGEPGGMPALIAEFIDAVGVKPATVIGNDSGGAMSQILATEHADSVGRLVLTNCDAFTNFPPNLFQYLLWVAKVPGALSALAQSLRIPFMRRSPVAYGVLAKSRLDSELLEDWVRPGIENAGVRHDTRKFIRGISPKQTERAAEKLSGLKAPALLAWAPEDKYFPIEHAERLAEIIPDSRLERIEDAKTFVSIDQPDRLAEVIDAFVRETTAKAAAAA